MVAKVSTVELQGFDVVAADLANTAQAVVTLAPEIVKAGGTAGVMYAKQRLMRKPNYRTGNLYASVRMDGQSPSPGLQGEGEPDIKTQHVGDQTIFMVDFFAEGKLGGTQIPGLVSGRLIEYGFFHTGAGRFVGPWPFMGPAKQVAEQTMVQMAGRLSGIAVGRLPRFKDPEANNLIRQFRAGMYTTAKQLGNLQVIFPGVSFGGIRTGLYEGARGLGDIEAGMIGVLGQRVTRRYTGRFAGMGISATRLTNTVSARIGGPLGSRLYNLYIGKQVGTKGLRKLD